MFILISNSKVNEAREWLVPVRAVPEEEVNGAHPASGYCEG